MKKTYLIPALTIVNVQTIDFIAASGIDTNTSTAGLNDEEVPSGIEGGSRRRSVWGEEEEFEDEQY